jgi:hypothetical protein
MQNPSAIHVVLELIPTYAHQTTTNKEVSTPMLVAVQRQSVTMTVSLTSAKKLMLQRSPTFAETTVRSDQESSEELTTSARTSPRTSTNKHALTNRVLFPLLLHGVTADTVEVVAADTAVHGVMEAAAVAVDIVEVLDADTAVHMVVVAATAEELDVEDADLVATAVS